MPQVSADGFSREIRIRKDESPRDLGAAAGRMDCMRLSSSGGFRNAPPVR